jgi:putative ABC transport system permease protein
VLAIGVGVGANAAMFGILDRLLVRGPAHVQDASRVERFYYRAQVPGMGEFSGNTLGYVAYTTLRDGTRAFAGVSGYSETDGVLGRGGAAEQITEGAATYDFFPLLGVHPTVGRFFDAAEDRPGAASRVAVLDYGLWRRRFAGDPGVLGHAVDIDGARYTVIGVAPAGFTGVETRRVDVWLPMSLRGAGMTPGSDEWRTSWDIQWMKIIGRLRPGVTRAQATADATRAFRLAYGGSEEPLKKAQIFVAPLHYEDDGQESLEVSVSRWLLGVSLIVLLVACANVANLLLARAVRHRQDIAVRLALGITRGRLAQLLLSQSLVLAFLGGLAALGLATLGGDLIRTTLLPDVAWTHAPVNGRVLLVAAGLALLTGLVTGLAPALQERRGLVDALRTGVREGGGRTSRARTALAVAQAALSTVLLVGAGLFVHSLWNARHMDLGLQPDRVLRVSADWPRAELSAAARPAASPEDLRRRRRARSADFYGPALERARALSGVEAAAIAVGTPFRSSFQIRLRVAGRDSMPRLPGGGPYIQAVSNGYFRTVGLRLVRGRAFSAADVTDSARVAVINRTMATTLWPGRTALGECLLLGQAEVPDCYRVIGVVENAHRYSLREKPAMQYYVPLGADGRLGFGGSALLVRPRGDLASMVAPLRSELRALDPSLLWLEVEPLEASLAPELRPFRLGATLFGLFGLLALLLASLGLYSLVAYTVASRAHELGVRVALGARGSDVLRLVLRQGLLLAAAGLALGMVVALAAGGYVRDLLFQDSPRDPLVYGVVVLALLAAAALASFGPARRATRVDAMAALKAE